MSYNIKQVLLIRRDLKMSRGKEIAQCAHASMGVILENATITGTEYKGEHRDLILYSPPKGTEEWFRESFAKITLQVKSEEELLELINKAKKAGIPATAILDSGTTSCGIAGKGVQVYTAGAIGPWHSKEIDKITGHLSLY